MTNPDTPQELYTDQTNFALVFKQQSIDAITELLHRTLTQSNLDADSKKDILINAYTEAKRLHPNPYTSIHAYFSQQNGAFGLWYQQASQALPGIVPSQQYFGVSATRSTPLRQTANRPKPSGKRSDSRT